MEKWYPTVEEGNNKGIVVLITSQKEGAVTGGPEFIKAVGDSVLDSIVSDNLPGIIPYLFRCYPSNVDWFIILKLTEQNVEWQILLRHVLSYSYA